MKGRAVILALCALCTLCALCAVLAAGACTRGARGGSGTRPVVGVSLLTETHAFYKELEGGLREEAAARNHYLLFGACGVGPAIQAAVIEDLLRPLTDAYHG